MSHEPARQSVFRRLGASGPVAVVLSFFPPLGGFVLLAFLTKLGPWLRAEGVAGYGYYLVLATVLVGASFVPTYSCAILAGWAFGFWAGWPVAVVSMTAGGLVAYAWGRWVSRDQVVAIIAEKPAWKAVHETLLQADKRRTGTVVALLRVPPASPYALVNFVLAAAKVPLVEYTLGTIVGLLPRTAMAVFAAASLEQLRFENVSKSWMQIAGIVASILVCIALGVMAKKALRQVARGNPS